MSNNLDPLFKLHGQIIPTALDMVQTPAPFPLSGATKRWIVEFSNYTLVLCWEDFIHVHLLARSSWSLARSILPCVLFVCGMCACQLQVTRCDLIHAMSRNIPTVRARTNSAFTITHFSHERVCIFKEPWSWSVLVANQKFATRVKLSQYYCTVVFHACGVADEFKKLSYSSEFEVCESMCFQACTVPRVAMGRQKTNDAGDWLDA